MPLDGITAKSLALELNTLLAEARVDKIQQPDRHDVILVLRQDNKNYRLLLSANPSSPRIHLSEETKTNPSQPPMFCMLLRKHLSGSRLMEISTPDYERIFSLRFLTQNELGDRLEKRLIVEIMGRHSNIILVNQEDTIHDAILHIDESVSRVREVMPARPYVLPPAQNKLTPRQVLDEIQSGTDWLGPTVQFRGLEKALLERLQGFSPQLCHEVAVRADIDGRQHIDKLNKIERGRLNRVVMDLMQKICAEAFSPTTYYTHPDALIPIDFHCLNLQSFAYARSENSISEAMDRFYLEKNRQNTLKQKRQHLERLINQALDHAVKKLRIHEKDVADGNKSKRYRHYGDLILAHLHLIKEGDAKLLATDYYDPEQPEVSIDLDPGLSGAQNAQRYFKRYNKAKTKLESGEKLASQDREEIAWLETLQRAMVNAADLDDLQALQQEMQQAGLSKKNMRRLKEEANAGPQPDVSGGQKPGRAGKKKNKVYQQTGPKQKRKKREDSKPLPPRRYTSSDGFQILVGRNNLQNDQLTLKTAQKDDIWLHVQKMPGTHVIIRAEKQAVPDQTLLEAAQIAAWFSRASQEGQPASVAASSKVPVDYCPVSHVKKPGGAKPGMVIYEHYQTLFVSPQDPHALAKSDL